MSNEKLMYQADRGSGELPVIKHTPDSIQAMGTELSDLINAFAMKHGVGIIAGFTAEVDREALPAEFAQKNIGEGQHPVYFGAVVAASPGMFDNILKGVVDAIQRTHKKLMMESMVSPN